MKNIIIGIIVGVILTIGVILVIQDYNITKSRIANIERYLVQQNQKPQMVDKIATPAPQVEAQ